MKKKGEEIQATSCDRQSFCGPKTEAYPKPGEAPAKFIENRKARGHAASMEMTQIRALWPAREQGLSRHKFHAGCGWFRRFMERGFYDKEANNFVAAAPRKCEEHPLSFQSYVVGLCRERDLQIGNAD